MWSFSGSQILASLILLILEIYPSDIAILTSLTYSFDRPLLGTFYSHCAFEGPGMILEQMDLILGL